MRKPNPINNLFKEHFLIFQEASAAVSNWQLANPQPAIRNQAVNPDASVADFLATEKEKTGAAMQTPIKDLVVGTYDAVKETVKDVATLPQKTLDIGTAAVGGAVSMATRLAGSAIKLPFRVGALAVTTPFGLAGNVGRHAIDLGIKIPFSLVNIMGSKISYPFLKVSEVAKTTREKITQQAVSAGDSIGSLGAKFRNNITELKLPGLGNINTQAANNNVEGENTMPVAKAA